VQAEQRLALLLKRPDRAAPDRGVLYLAKVAQLWERQPPPGAAHDAGAQVRAIQDAIEGAPKSRGWKMRSRIGERSAGTRLPRRYGTSCRRAGPDCPLRPGWAVSEPRSGFGANDEGSCAADNPRRGVLQMPVVLIALIVIVVLALLGFGLHFLWWIALIALVIWLLGFVLRLGEGVGRSRRRRWYRW